MALKFGRELAACATIAVLANFGTHSGAAQELRITIPRFSSLTPVQRLNREGVEAARKHQLEKAQALFYKAYLYDPADPFTLNNLGYAAELQGDAVRANQFYTLAGKQACDAVVDLSSLKELQGKPMLYALQDLKDAPMRLNRMNVQAIELLIQNRGFEAERLLRRALEVEPHNPFTLNNLGVAEEMTGDLEGAAASYGVAAADRSSQTIIVSPKRSWRGKAISEMAAANLKRVNKELAQEGPEKARAAMLAFRGVTAINGNEWEAAKQDFLQAYSLDPASAFALNNLGYVAEKEGDMETAQFYYAKARRAGDADARVGTATQNSVEGQRLAVVATGNDTKVNSQLQQYSQMRQNEPQNPQLVPRGAGLTPSPSNKVPEPSKAAPETPQLVPRGAETTPEPTQSKPETPSTQPAPSPQL